MCALPSAANGTALGCLLVILSFLFFRQQDDTPSTVPASRNGFWGVEDAVHTFCEPSYSQTVYAAELWNSLGSLVFVAVGLENLRRLHGIGHSLRGRVVTESGRRREAERSWQLK